MEYKSRKSSKGGKVMYLCNFGVKHNIFCWLFYYTYYWRINDGKMSQVRHYSDRIYKYFFFQMFYMFQFYKEWHKKNNLTLKGLKLTVLELEIIKTELSPPFFIVWYSVMYSEGNSFCEDVLDSFNMAYRDQKKNFRPNK